MGFQPLSLLFTSYVTLGVLTSGNIKLVVYKIGLRVPSLGNYLPEVAMDGKVPNTTKALTS